MLEPGLLHSPHVTEVSVEDAHRIYDRCACELLYLKGYSEDDICVSSKADYGGVLVENGRKSDRYVPVRLAGLME